MRINIDIGEKIKFFLGHIGKTLLVLCVLALMFVLTVATKESTTEKHFIFSVSADYNFENIDKKIAEGMALLKVSSPLEYETTNGKKSGGLLRRQIALAILDKKTGNIFEKRVWVEQDSLKEVKKTGLIELIPEEGGPSVFNISVGWWNTFNTLYVIDNPDLIVVANKYLIDREQMPEQSGIMLSLDAPQDSYVDMVYAPYSEALHWPAVIKQGREYITSKLETAFEELEKDKVMSKAESDQVITDTIDKKLITNIILTEQIDTKSLLVSDDGGRRLAERVLVILGANKEWAYRYTGSSAGATGMAQFIEPTYNSMVTLYPDARLITDYELGMADHTNAIKAMVLFLDSHKSMLQGSIYNEEGLQNGITNEMLAATYNGGPSRAIRSVNAEGADWEYSDIYREETSRYIQKYKKIDILNMI